MFNGYHILLKFFKNGYKGNDYNKNDYLHHEKHSIEGDLQGVLEKIDYLKDLGIDLVYLGPIYDAETTHAYDTKDYFSISENLAYKDKSKSEDLLRELIKEFHKNGIKVILDLVLNHASKNYKFENIPFDLIPKTESPQTAQEKRWQSLFLFWDVSDLQTKEFLIRVGEYWLEKFDIDGYRLDHAIGLPTSFWFDFSNRMKNIKKDVVLLGEIWDDQGSDEENYNLINNFLFFKNENVFTSLFDFSFYSKLVTILTKNQDLKLLYNAIVESDKLNFENAKMTYFIENHDLPRFIDYNDYYDDFKIALSTIFVMNGNLMLEYGNEICIKGDKSYKYFNESGRIPMKFENEWDKENRYTYNYTKKLIDLRKKEAIMKHGKYKYLNSSNNFLYFSKIFDDNELNFLFVKEKISNITNKEFINLIDEKKYSKMDYLNSGVYFFYN